MDFDEICGRHYHEQITSFYETRTGTGEQDTRENLNRRQSVLTATLNLANVHSECSTRNDEATIL